MGLPGAPESMGSVPERVHALLGKMSHADSGVRERAVKNVAHKMRCALFSPTAVEAAEALVPALGAALLPADASADTTVAGLEILEMLSASADTVFAFAERNTEVLMQRLIKAVPEELSHRALAILETASAEIEKAKAAQLPDAAAPQAGPRRPPTGSRRPAAPAQPASGPRTWSRCSTAAGRRRWCSCRSRMPRHSSTLRCACRCAATTKRS